MKTIILQGETLNMDAIKKAIKDRATKEKPFVDATVVCEGGDDMDLFLRLKEDEALIALDGNAETVPFDDVEGIRSVRL